MENIYVRLLQFLINTEVDGDFGPNSKAAANALIAKLDQWFDDWANVSRKEGRNGNDQSV